LRMIMPSCGLSGSQTLVRLKRSDPECRWIDDLGEAQPVSVNRTAVLLTHTIGTIM
jgi:hypothetical protein